MADWWSYGLSDFLLFSSRAYFRLFELHNRAVWPAPVLTPALGLTLLLLLLRQAVIARRLVPLLLGALWIWIAWTFLWQRYATINWAAAYAAPAYALQGVALVWLGAARGGLRLEGGRSGARTTALALFAAAVILYPSLSWLSGRSWRAAEVFGIAPDPTAIATLAVLALAPARTRWPLAILPALWCGLSSVTLWALESEHAFVPVAGALAALGISVFAGRPRSQA